MATFNEISAQQLRSLCVSLGRQRSLPEYLLLQRFLFEGWGDNVVPLRPNYRSLIGDDHSPYEYSVAFGNDGIELRILLEAQGRESSREGNHRAALQLTRRLSEIFPISLERFESVADLLCPQEPASPFSLWHAVSLPANKPPSFKVYLNPQLRGRDQAVGVVREAFGRLGFGAASEVLCSTLALRGGGLDELSYFSLDLSDEPEARVKVYFCHHAATAAEVERIFSAAPTHRPGDAVEFCQEMVGHTGPFIRKPVTSCFSFVSASDDPTGVTMHLPISHYLSDDSAVAERIHAFLLKHGHEADRYAELFRRFPAPVDPVCSGLQSYASYRRERGGLRLTVYLSPGLYQAAETYVTSEPPRITGVFSTTSGSLAAEQAAQ